MKPYQITTQADTRSKARQTRAFLNERKAAIALAPYCKRRRPATLRALGLLLHPEAITEAWYAAQCPPRLSARGVPLGLWLRWRVACILRGADRTA